MHPDTPMKIGITLAGLAIVFGWLYWVHYDITHYDRIDEAVILCRIQSNGKEVCMETGEYREVRIPKR